MPIRREHRFFYPIDWRELSAVIRFGRAKGQCEGCGRPHGRTVFCLGDGRWWGEDAGSWRDGAGRIVCLVVGADDVLAAVRTTRVVLAIAHRNRHGRQPASRPRGVVPALPHAARPAGARPQALAHGVPTEGSRRPISWALQLGARPSNEFTG